MRTSKQVMVGRVPLGGGAPVTVQVTDFDEQTELNTDKLDALSRFDNIKFE